MTEESSPDVSTDFVDPRPFVFRLFALSAIAIVFSAGAMLAVWHFDYGVGLILMIASGVGSLSVALFKRALAWVVPMLLVVMSAVLILQAARIILAQSA
jgi:hypothetical protein